MSDPQPATPHLMRSLGLRPVVNAVGSPTRLGGTRYSEAVVAAMAEASRYFVPISELQRRAAEAIRQLTGAEAGIVTTGAAGSLFLGACAILAGEDRAAMHALPDTGERPDELIVHRTHRSPYDHVVRAAGAKLVEFGYDWEGVGAYPWQIDSLLSPRTAGVLYFSNAEDSGLPLREVCEIAHTAGVPVLLDAAEEPTSDRMRELVDAGADLVAISGGKAIGGPAGTGILAGRADLIRSAALQQQDMYTTPELFTGPFGDSSPLSEQPAHHGLGRVLKLGREQIVGLIVAIELFLSCDHEAVAGERRRMIETIASALRGHPEVEVTISDTPVLEIHFRGPDGRRRATAVAQALLSDDPRIFVDDGRLRFGSLRIGARSLVRGEAELVAARLVGALDALGNGGPPH